MKPYGNALKAGSCQNTVRDIKIEEGVQPRAVKPRPLRREEMSAVNEQIKELEKEGIIEKAHEGWASPTVLAPKKDGYTRLCVDYQKLNMVTEKDAYPLPRISDMIATLAGSTCFSSLDLQSGYHQISVKEEFGSLQNSVCDSTRVLSIQGNAVQFM